MQQSSPPTLLQLVFGFLAVGVAWGFTTPFIRRAALTKPPAPRPQLHHTHPWIYTQLVSIAHAILSLLKTPSYTIPLILNLSGSALFFLIVGQAELSLTVPITNSLAFLFTVLGEWLAEGKSISKETMLGMLMVLSGIAICVHSKS